MDDIVRNAIRQIVDIQHPELSLVDRARVINLAVRIANSRPGVTLGDAVDAALDVLFLKARTGEMYIEPEPRKPTSVVTVLRESNEEGEN